MQIETIRVNVLGMLNLADICLEKKLHLTTYATGCIFHYDKDFPEGSGKGFKEEDTPNFTGSYYSYTKVMMASLSAVASSFFQTLVLHAPYHEVVPSEGTSLPCWRDEDVPSHCKPAFEAVYCISDKVQGAACIAGGSACQDMVLVLNMLMCLSHACHVTACM